MASRMLRGKPSQLETSRENVSAIVQQLPDISALSHKVDAVRIPHAVHHLAEVQIIASPYQIKRPIQIKTAPQNAEESLMVFLRERHAPPSSSAPALPAWCAKARDSLASRYERQSFCLRRRHGSARQDHDHTG
jgi:hypothetical protein